MVWVSVGKRNKCDYLFLLIIKLILRYHLNDVKIFSMKHFYSISLILLSSYQLCFSNTLSVGNATYTVPEDWTTSQYASRAESINASKGTYFYTSTGFPFMAIGPTEEYTYIPDISGFENGSIQNSESAIFISNKLDTDIYSSILKINDFARDHIPVYETIHLTPISFKLLAEGAYERTYNFTVRLINENSSPRVTNVQTGTIGIIIDADSISYYRESENMPDNNSLTLEETSTLYNISDSYTTSNPLTIIDKPTDSDLDGIPDTIETYLGNDPNDNSDAQASLDGIQSKYSLDEIVDLRAGSTMIEVNNDRANLDLQIESSEDLALWTVDENTFYDIPTYSVDHIKFSIPADELGSWTISGNLSTIVTEKFSTSADGTEAFITVSAGELASWTVEGNLSTNISDASVNVPVSELGSWTVDGNLCTIKTDKFVTNNGVPFLIVSSPANAISTWTLEDNTFIVNQNEAYLNLKLPISSFGSWTVDGTTFKVSPHKSIVSDDEQNFILEIPRTALGWWTVDGADFIVSEDPIGIRVGGNAKFQIPVDADSDTKFFRFKMEE